MLSALAITMALSCEKSEIRSEKVSNDDNIREDIILTKSQEGLVKCSNEFSFRLFNEILKLDPMSNTAFSPLGVTYAMGMINNGACGETEKEISSAMGFGNSKSEINEFCKLITEKLINVDKTTTLEIANMIISNSLYSELKENFRNVVGEMYDAEISRIDFSGEKVLGAINDWCSKKTHGMIPSILSEIDPNALLYAMNAIYFKGAWTNKFDRSKTTRSKFVLPDGSSKVENMMAKKEMSLFLENEDFKVLCLPYGNGAFEMNLILPLKGNITEVIENLSADKWYSIKSNLSKEEVDIKLPRLEIWTSMGLNACMEQLGIRKPFDPISADFKDLNEDNQFFISLIKQNAKITIDEEGTSAAATTIIGIDGSNLKPKNPVMFHADHPFLFTISEFSTGCILFIGQYTGEEAK